MVGCYTAGLQDSNSEKGRSELPGNGSPTVELVIEKEERESKSKIFGSDLRERKSGERECIAYL